MAGYVKLHGAELPKVFSSLVHLYRCKHSSDNNADTTISLFFVFPECFDNGTLS